MAERQAKESKVSEKAQRRFTQTVKRRSAVYKIPGLQSQHQRRLAHSFFSLRASNHIQTNRLRLA